MDFVLIGCQVLFYLKAVKAEIFSVNSEQFELLLWTICIKEWIMFWPFNKILCKTSNYDLAVALCVKCCKGILKLS